MYEVQEELEPLKKFITLTIYKQVLIALILYSTD